MCQRTEPKKKRKHLVWYMKCFNKLFIQLSNNLLSSVSVTSVLGLFLDFYVHFAKVSLNFSGCHIPDYWMNVFRGHAPQISVLSSTCTSDIILGSLIIWSVKPSRLKEQMNQIHEILWFRFWKRITGLGEKAPPSVWGLESPCRFWPNTCTFG